MAEKMVPLPPDSACLLLGKTQTLQRQFLAASSSYSACPTLPKVWLKDWQRNQELQPSTNNSSFAKNMLHNAQYPEKWVPGHLKMSTKLAGIFKITL